jgi:hypothetical protein
MNDIFPKYYLSDGRIVLAKFPDPQYGRVIIPNSRPERNKGIWMELIFIPKGRRIDGYVWAIVLQTSQENIQDLKWEII